MTLHSPCDLFENLTKLKFNKIPDNTLLNDLRTGILQTCSIHAVSSKEHLNLVVEKSNGLLLFVEDIPHCLLDICTEAFLNVMNAVTKSTIDFDLNYDSIIRILISICFEVGNQGSDLRYLKIIANVLTALELALRSHRSGDELPLSDLLGLCRYFMFCGLPNWETLTMCPVFPQFQTLHEPAVGDYPQYNEISRDVRDASGKKLRRRKVRPRLARGTIKCDSETLARPYRFSLQAETDVEIPQQVVPCLYSLDSASDSECAERDVDCRIMSSQTRVRQLSLMLLLSVVAGANRRQLLGFWPALTPDSLSTSGGRSLAAVLRDPSNRCRQLAASVLQRLLSHSRPLLRGVDELSAQSGAFESFSATLAALLRELHRFLLLTLLSERDIAARAAVLRALATLVSNTPYCQMRSGLLTRLSRHVRFFLTARDTSTKCLAFDVLVAMVSTRQQLPEVAQLLRTASVLPPAVSPLADSFSALSSCDECDTLLSDMECEEESLDDTVTAEKAVVTGCWFWDRCRSFVLRRDARNDKYFYPQQVRVHAMRAMCLLCQSYLSVLDACLPDLTCFLERCMCSDDGVMRLYSVRLLECLSAGAPDSSVDIFPVWQHMLAGPLPPMAHWDQSEAIRAGFCHAVSTMGSGVFERLSQQARVLCVTLLLPLASSESEPMVCSAAVRVLGVLVAVPSLRHNLDFLLQVGECTCAAVPHELALVRENAAWTLANLTDVLETAACGEQALSPGCVAALMEAALAATADGDKVRVSGVRAIGNLLRHVSARYCTGEEEQDQVECVRKQMIEAIGVLRSCMHPNGKSTHMKVVWNACYAYNNAMKNTNLHDQLQQMDFFDAFCVLCRECSNFKARCSAAAALAAPNTRAFYGTSFCHVWSVVVEALELAQNIENLNELKHREALVGQLCLTMCHLASLVETSDLSSLVDTLIQHWESVITQMRRIAGVLTPEGCRTILEAVGHVRQLPASAEQERLLQLLEAVQECSTSNHQDISAL